MPRSFGSATTDGDDPSSLRRGWASWLAEFRWDHAVTLTTRFAWSRERLLREFHERFVRRLGRNAQRSIPYFLIVEEATPGHPHLHALLVGTRELTVEGIRRAWKAGMSNCQPLRDVTSVAAYVTKGIAREPDDYRIVGRWCRWSEVMPGSHCEPRGVAKGGTSPPAALRQLT